MSDRNDEPGSPKLAEFRDRVYREFGPNLEKATPANVRDFLDSFQENAFSPKQHTRFELNESKTTYEEILKDFFVRVLDRPTDDALITLWLMAFELSFYGLEQHLSDRLQALFSELNEDN